MVPDKELLLLGCDELIKVYDSPDYDIEHTEWNDRLIRYKNKKVQALTIGGSNEKIDWAWNFNLNTVQGLKACNFDSVIRILQHFNRKKDLGLYIFCHSKSGGTGARLGQILGAMHTVCYCPAPAFETPETIEDCTLVIDPDDPVPNLGKPFLVHPDCNVVYLVDDPGLISVKDHLIHNVKSSINSNQP